ncbi:MAG: NAD(P)H-quinone oxidoreductase [Nocardioidaceae bacterium]|nr:NAD(P)H-quinone oxidoreductase [Nocardioidaceae bacterium]
MRAVLCREAGGPEVLELAERPDPEPKTGEVVIEVAASAVNRADLMQREGRYPPPPGESDVLGLECSGTIVAVGDGVTRWQIGDEVCALLASGGYADKVAAPAGQVLPVPPGVSLVEAAALPEVTATVWSNVFMVAALQPDEVFLVHGAGGGIGTMAIQLAAALGARVACTVGSADKAEICRELGAELAINYREQDFVEEVRRLNGSGADVILDNMGASYLARNVDALATEGRLVVIGLQGGAQGELDLRNLLGKRGAVIATGLRSRPAAGKAAIMASVEANVWPLIAGGRVRPIVHTSYPLEDVRAAHELVESSAHIGKVLLTT